MCMYFDLNYIFIYMNLHNCIFVGLIHVYFDIYSVCMSVYLSLALYPKLSLLLFFPSLALRQHLEDRLLNLEKLNPLLSFLFLLRIRAILSSSPPFLSLCVCVCACMYMCVCEPVYFSTFPRLILHLVLSFPQIHLVVSP